MAKYKKTTLTEISEPWETGTYDGDFSCVRRFPSPSDNTCKHCGKAMGDHGWIDTLEGGHIVCPNDRICTGAKDEKYPIKPDVFASTYEAADALDTTGVGQIVAERKRQIKDEGWTPEHDAQHTDGSLAAAAICYLANGNNGNRIRCAVQVQDKLLSLRAIPSWPASWATTWDKRGSIGYRRSLVIAGALAAAEIDRIQAAEEPQLDSAVAQVLGYEESAGLEKYRLPDGNPPL